MDRPSKSSIPPPRSHLPRSPVVHPMMGLISYVFTGDEAVGMCIAERMEAGMVAINRGIISDPAAPFGGIEQSGIGSEGSHFGLAEFQESKHIGSDW